MSALGDDLHQLTGSFALDALDGTELRVFKRHLARCGHCAIEVRDLRETAARLAMAAAIQPPARIAAPVLAATFRTRQLSSFTIRRHRRGLRPAAARRRLRPLLRRDLRPTADEILEQIERQSLGPGPRRLTDDVAILLLHPRSR